MNHLSIISILQEHADDPSFVIEYLRQSRQPRKPVARGLANQAPTLPRVLPRAVLTKLCHPGLLHIFKRTLHLMEPIRRPSNQTRPLPHKPENQWNSKPR